MSQNYASDRTTVCSLSEYLETQLASELSEKDIEFESEEDCDYYLNMEVYKRERDFVWEKYQDIGDFIKENAIPISFSEGYRRIVTRHFPIFSHEGRYFFDKKHSSRILKALTGYKDPLWEQECGQKQIECVAVAEI